MSSPEKTDSTRVACVTPLTATTIEKPKIDPTQNDPKIDDANKNDTIDTDVEKKEETIVNEHPVARSESVIKSPSKPLSSPTPVIQVVDTTSSSSVIQRATDHIESSSTTTTKRSNIFSSVTSQSSSSNSPSSSSLSFIQPISNIAPNNPFLRATSFHSNSASDCPSSDNSDSDSKNTIVFAPPKLASSSKPDTNFLQPPSLKASVSGDSKQPNETVSSSYTFISLNKEDIGKIKVPSFIKNTSLNLTNGAATAIADDNKCVKSQLNTFINAPKPNFLFGQKLEDRVVLDNTYSHNDLKSSDNNKSSDHHLISFSDVTKSEETITGTELENSTTKNECGSSMKNGENDSVFKRKYEVITGEENEQNVLTMYGKLFAWDTEKASWVEKGRGHLRLNDFRNQDENEKLCSRLVMRTAGALRLILNSHLVSGMKFELASENCLRFTCVDGIFMIKGNPKDIDQLRLAIQVRLREMSKKVKLLDTKQDDEE